MLAKFFSALDKLAKLATFTVFPLIPKCVKTMCSNGRRASDIRQSVCGMEVLALMLQRGG